MDRDGDVVRVFRNVKIQRLKSEIGKSKMRSGYWNFVIIHCKGTKIPEAKSSFGFPTSILYL
jgi:hypothetical protein